MKPTILITGANGAVAQKFKSQYGEQFEIRFLTRSPKSKEEYKWDVATRCIDEKAFVDVDHVIHLAGANIAGSRWTASRKIELRESRIVTGKMITDALEKGNIVLKSYITASAVGYYGSDTSEQIFKESDAPSDDFVGSVCKEWEDVADQIVQKDLADRSCKLRFGIVLDKKSGLLERVSPIVKIGLGSALGSGKQYIPWIHISDLSTLLYKTLTSSMSGAYNAIAPEHVTNDQLMRAIAGVLNRPYFLPKVPSFVLKIVFGKMSEVVLHGSRVSADKILKENFHFEYPTVNSALKELLT